MDRQAFKQRMQNLKSYRENNPGKGYWDWKVEAFADGGQTGDPEKERFYQATGRSSSGRPLEEGLKPVFSLEDAANMTPIGDAISAKDAYNAVKNRDWLGAGLAAATMIPFVPMSVKSYRKKYKGVTPKREIPTVNKDARNDAINEAIKYKESGLINHELGHRIDRQAGVIGPQGQLNIPIFDRSKFESTERLKQIYPKTYDRIQNYLLKDSEIKSHMNAFRTYLRDNNMLGPNGKETLNSFKKKLFNSDFDNLKKIFNSYKSGKQFIQDFNMIPITKVNNNNNTLV